MAADKIIFPHRQVDVAAAEGRFPSQGSPGVSSVQSDWAQQRCLSISTAGAVALRSKEAWVQYSTPSLHWSIGVPDLPATQATRSYLEQLQDRSKLASSPVFVLGDYSSATNCSESLCKWTKLTNCPIGTSKCLCSALKCHILSVLVSAA